MLKFNWLRIFVKIAILFAICQKVNAGNTFGSKFQENVNAEDISNNTIQNVNAGNTSSSAIQHKANAGRTSGNTIQGKGNAESISSNNTIQRKVNAENTSSSAIQHIVITGNRSSNIIQQKMTAGNTSGSAIQHVANASRTSGMTILRKMDAGNTSSSTIHRQKVNASSITNEKVQIQNERKAEELRAMGNVKYRNGYYDLAIELYTQSLKEMISSTTLSNRAEAYLQIENFEKALADAENALKLDPTNSLTKYRKACALLGLNKHAEITIEELDEFLGHGIDEEIENMKAKVIAKKLERLDVKGKMVSHGKNTNIANIKEQRLDAKAKLLSANQNVNENFSPAIVGLDCEFVGNLAPGLVDEREETDILARVSIVDQSGKAIYDKYVLPTKTVTNYRTQWSGIRPENLRRENGAIDFWKAQREVASIIKGKIVVGHQLDSDFGVLQLEHPPELIRDTASVEFLRKGLRGRFRQGNRRWNPSLKELAKFHLGIDFQQGEHDSIEDAWVPVQIYLQYRDKWESSLKAKERGKGKAIENRRVGIEEKDEVDDDDDEEEEEEEEEDEFTMNELLGNDKYNQIYYKIMAKYEMRESDLIGKKQRIANQYKLNYEQMDELFNLYEFSRKSLATSITNGMGTKEYLEKFKTFAHLLKASEEIENNKVFEDNVRGRRILFREKYIAYELTVNQWNEEYRLRGKIVLGKAVGIIVELDKGSKRIVAKFNQKEEEEITTQAQRLSSKYNDNNYRISLLTFRQIEKQNGMRFALFPNAEKLVAYHHFMKKRNEDWRNFLMKIESNNKKFNDKQSEAIYSIVNGSHGNVPFILWGPPGTGKTVTIIEAIRQLILNSRENRILICTPSNASADLIAKKILNDRIVPESKLRRYYALGRLVQERDRQLDKIICMADDDFMGTPMMKFEICGLEESRIVIMTLSASAVLEESDIGRNFFSHIFIDEAAQALELDTLIPIARYANEKTRIILSGDHKQLGPVVTAMFLKKQYCGSLINRLITSFKNTVYKDARTTVKLIQNYRSHEAILKFPSNNFYGGQLIAANTAKRSSFTNWEELPKKGFPIIFHILEDGEELQERNSYSFWNQRELEKVVRYVQSLMNGRGQRGVPADLTYEQIGVISPYKLQTQKIRSALGFAKGITVDSVERFQGSDRRVIIMTLTRTNKMGFLQDVERINTTITRAEELLIIIMSEDLRKHFNKGLWQSFLKYCDRNGGIVYKQQQQQDFHGLPSQGERSYYMAQQQHSQGSPPQEFHQNLFNHYLEHSLAQATNRGGSNQASSSDSNHRRKNGGRTGQRNRRNKREKIPIL